MASTNAVSIPDASRQPNWHQHSNESPVSGDVNFQSVDLNQHAASPRPIKRIAGHFTHRNNDQESPTMGQKRYR